MRVGLFAALAVVMLVLAGVSGGGLDKVARCSARLMTASADVDVAAASGENPVLIRLVNRGQRPCVLFGYPQVRVFDGAGRVLHFAIHDGSDQVVTSRRARSIRVARHGSAWTLLNTFRCDTGPLARASAAVIALPNEPEAWRLRVPYRAYYCRNRISVSPFEAKRAATFAQH